MRCWLELMVALIAPVLPALALAQDRPPPDTVEIAVLKQREEEPAWTTNLTRPPDDEGLAGASDDRLRGPDCRDNLLHVVPSRAMLTDALAQ